MMMANALVGLAGVATNTQMVQQWRRDSTDPFFITIYAELPETTSSLGRKDVLLKLKDFLDHTDLIYNFAIYTSWSFLCGILSLLAAFYGPRCPLMYSLHFVTVFLALSLNSSIGKLFSESFQRFM